MNLRYALLSLAWLGATAGWTVAQDRDSDNRRPDRPDARRDEGRPDDRRRPDGRPEDRRGEEGPRREVGPRDEASPSDRRPGPGPRDAGPRDDRGPEGGRPEGGPRGNERRPEPRPEHRRPEGRGDEGRRPDFARHAPPPRHDVRDHDRRGPGPRPQGRGDEGRRPDFARHAPPHHQGDPRHMSGRHHGPPHHHGHHGPRGHEFARHHGPGPQHFGHHQGGPRHHGDYHRDGRHGHGRPDFHRGPVRRPDFHAHARYSHEGRGPSRPEYRPAHRRPGPEGFGPPRGRGEWDAPRGEDRRPEGRGEGDRRRPEPRHEDRRDDRRKFTSNDEVPSAADGTYFVVQAQEGSKEGGDRRRGGFGGGPGGAGGMGLSALVASKDVKADVGISDDQAAKVEAFDKEQAEKRRALFQSGGDREEIRKKMQEIGAETEKKMGEILSPEQVTRLKQIMVQAAEKRMGLVAVVTTDGEDKLGLSEDQKKQVAEIREEMGKSMREAFQGGAGGGREKMAELSKSASEKIAALLTDNQKAKLDQLRGKPFTGELPQPSFGGGRRPGGNQPSN